MMKLSFTAFLSEADAARHVVLSFGRMNPPTNGHEKLVNVVHKTASKYKADQYIILTRSHDPKKNPLTPEQKERHARRAFPDSNISVASETEPTLMHHLKKLHAQGYTHLHMIAGSDRTADFENMIKKYNGHPDHWNFKSIKVHSSGKRDPDSEGIEGMSASKMRGHAASGDFESFKQGVPSKMKTNHVREMYNDIRKNMIQ